MTIDELAKLDRLISGKPEDPPERIFGWLDSQLSIARHYGAIDYQGHRYVISYHEKGAPLVRDDVIKREAQEALATLKNEADAYAARQDGLF